MARPGSGVTARGWPVAATIALLTLPASLSAQLADVSMNVQPEVRVDAFLRDGRQSVEAGAGVQIPAGYYVRIGVIGAAGTTFDDGSSSASGRVDILGRFLFDPFRQSGLGVSAGAGLSLRAQRGDRVRPLLMAALDIEGRQRGNGMSPAIQLGLGGGVRLGVGLRWGSARVR